MGFKSFKCHVFFLNIKGLNMTYSKKLNLNENTKQKKRDQLK